MACAIVIVLAVGGILILGSLAWSAASHYRSLPCPTALAWLLDNPLAGRVLGTRSTLEWMGLRPGQRVLEIGPGPGRVLIPAARQVLPGGEVVGLGIQPGMLDRLKARAAQSGVTNLTAVLGDATQPHFPPESFDVVYLCTALAEIRDREEALRQCWQALKPGGRLSITEVMVDPALPIACDRAAAGRSRRVPAGARVQPGVSLHGQFRQGVEALLAAPWQAKL